MRWIIKIAFHLLILLGFALSSCSLAFCIDRHWYEKWLMVTWYYATRWNTIMALIPQHTDEIYERCFRSNSNPSRRFMLEGWIPYSILPLHRSIDVNIDVMAISVKRLESQYNENCYNKQIYNRLSTLLPLLVEHIVQSKREPTFNRLTDCKIPSSSFPISVNSLRCEHTVSALEQYNSCLFKYNNVILQKWTVSFCAHLRFLFLKLIKIEIHWSKLTWIN